MTDVICAASNVIGDGLPAGELRANLKTRRKVPLPPDLSSLASLVMMNCGLCSKFSYLGR